LYDIIIMIFIFNILYDIIIMIFIFNIHLFGLVAELFSFAKYWYIAKLKISEDIV